MSARYLGDVWMLKLDTTAKLLMAYLADGADHAGRIAPQETKLLAEVVDRNPKTTNRALRTLEEQGLLFRTPGTWRLRLFPDYKPLFDEPDTTQEGGPAMDPKPDEAPAETIKPAESSKPDDAAEAAREELPADQVRFGEFANAFGPSHSKPTNAFDAWLELEKSEAKHNRKEKHTKDGETWIKQIESIDEIMPAIINAVECYQARLDAGLPVHATDAREFLEKQLWLAPEYQGKPELIGGEPEHEYDEAELDDMVLQMNQKGGHFQTHLRMTSKNPHTGEMETETLAIYRNRVLAKWNQYQAQSVFFEE